MSKNNPQAIHLKDYRVPAFLIDNTELHFELGDKAIFSRVVAPTSAEQFQFVLIGA